MPNIKIYECIAFNSLKRPKLSKSRNVKHAYYVDVSNSLYGGITCDAGLEDELSGTTFLKLNFL